MKIYNCGVIVKPHLSSTEMMITAASIRFGKVTYELKYFEGADEKTIWMAEGEFIVSDPSQKKTVGFK